MRKLLVEIDARLLAVVFFGRRWCVEWLSWSTKWIERVLMCLYVLPLGGNCEFRAVQQHSHLAMAMWPVWALVTWVSLWREHRRPHDMRLLKLATWTDVRLFLVATIPLVGVGAVLPPHQWSDWVLPASATGLALFQYSTSLPDAGEPGRRRKLALAKLKELFGTSWVPVPQPGG